MKKILLIAFFAGFLMLSISGCSKEGTTDKPKDTQGKETKGSPEEIKKMEEQFTAFAKTVEDTLKIHYKNVATAYWNASISGKPEDFQIASDMEMKFNNFLSNKETFKKFKDFKESGLVQEAMLGRELLLLYNTFLSYQVDTALLNEMTKQSLAITEKFQTYRAKVGKKELTDNQVEEVLKTATDSKKLKETWEAHKNIGPVVAQDIIKLVKMRNEVAKSLGFSNYHEMSLKLSDQEPADIDKLFNELDELTKDEFKKLKGDIDAFLAKKYNVKPEELMPWHYQNRYFQEAPAIYDIDLDKYYKGKDVIALTVKYFNSLGMPIEDMVAKSDLKEKKGKNQHAFCTDIDRDTKDVRVLCNVKDNKDWMETMLHEYGHAVYFKYHDAKLPWVLRTPAHTFTTEAIAMIFGRLASNGQYMKEMLGLSDEEVAKVSEIGKKIMKLQQLVFSRWSQVMYRFEKSMYDNPDQDLNKLWWELVERYQMIKKPAERSAPDWATKIHIATSPCYYHNYHLGELLASQLYYYITSKILNLKEGEETSFFGKTEVGKYLIDKVFMPGALYYWNDMIEKATGEKLTAKYYAMQFVK